MTTPAAAARYLADHVAQYRGRNLAVYNPHNKPVETLPIIYGFNNGGSSQWYEALAVSEDGMFLGQHICSHELYMPSDLGCIEGTRPDRHADAYQKHYPDGYRMEFVGYDEIKGHEGIKAAFAAADKRKSEGENIIQHDPAGAVITVADDSGNEHQVHVGAA